MMSKPQKALTTVLWAVLVLTMVGVISAGLFRSGDRTAPADNGMPVADVHVVPAELDLNVPDFSLTNQDGQTVTAQSLRGKVWIVQFIFTSCAGPCPEMAKKFASLEKTITDPDVKFVSISVDPVNDTPAVLKAWGSQFGAQFDRWMLLTGDKDVVYRTAKAMLVAVEPGTANSPLMHSERFILIDSTGKIRSIVESGDADAMAKMVQDAQTYAADARKVRPS
jgi:protein SCO1/2